MWNYNVKDLEKETTGGMYLDRSGCYNAIIEDFKLSKTSGGSDQAIITFNIEGAKTTIYHIYSDKNGTVLDWKLRHLNHLLYLTKSTNITNPDLLKNKHIGVFLKAKLSQCKQYINFDLEGFYHLQQLKTAKELSKGTEAAEVEKMEMKYGCEEPLKREVKSNNSSDPHGHIEKYNNSELDGGTADNNDDEFPF